MLVAKFITSAPIAGCSGGTSGKRRRISGAIARAIARSSPPSIATRIRPSIRIMTPVRLMTSVTACFAPSKLAADTSCIRPVNAP